MVETLVSAFPVLLRIRREAQKREEKMKHYIGLCLLLAGNVVSQDVRIMEALPDEENAVALSNVKPVETIKNELMRWFLSNNPIPPRDIQRYRDAPDVTDEAMRAALMDIYQSVQHLGDVPFQLGDSAELVEEKRRLRRTIEFLGHCADESAKRLLLDIANDETKANTYRATAVSASIQCADAQQVRDVLLRFIVDKQFKSSSFLWRTTSVYDEVECDPQKREAILATLIVLLAREENKSRFADMDKKVAERSKEYATSSQRLAMLQRMSKLPPDKFPKTDPDLNTALDSFRFRFFKTNVSTNMTELMTRDFRKSE